MRRGHPVIDREAVCTPLAELLTRRPELREALPLAEALDAAAREA